MSTCDAVHKDGGRCGKVLVYGGCPFARDHKRVRP